MADAKRDDNRVNTLLGVSSVDGTTPLPVQVDPATGRMLVSVIGAGLGDVTAGANMTDNALIRGDGGAKGIQDSGWLLSDTDVLTSAGNLDMSGNSIVFTTTTITDVLDEDNMVSDSATALATQQSIKAYVDAQVATADTLSEVLALGNTTGGTDIEVTSGDAINATSADLVLQTTTSGSIQLNAVDTVAIGDSVATSVTIGGTAFPSKLSIEAEGASDLAEVDIHRHSATAGLGGHMVISRSRGTHGAQTAVQDNDYVMRLVGVGHDGTDYEEMAQIDFVVDGTVSNNVVPGEMLFLTANTSGTLTQAMRIGSAQEMELSGTFNIQSSTAVDSILDEDNMASDSATALATQQSIKAYVDAQVATVDTFLELTDTPGSYTTANAIYTTNGTPNAVIETTVILTEGANTFNITKGTAVLDIAAGSTLNVDANLTVESASFINQDVTSDAAPTFAGVTLTGDITTTGAAVDWDLIDNTASALSFDSAGKAGILEIDTTDGSETVKMSGNLNIGSSTSVSGVLDEDDMSSDSPTDLATQQSIKAYVDSQASNIFIKQLPFVTVEGTTNSFGGWKKGFGTGVPTGDLLFLTLDADQTIYTKFTGYQTSNDQFEFDQISSVTSVILEGYVRHSGTAAAGKSSFWGFLDASSNFDYTTDTNTKNQVGFIFDDTTDFLSKTGNGSSQTQNALTITNPQTAWHKLKIVWTSADAKFYVDDVLEDTITTNLPTSSADVAIGFQGDASFVVDTPTLTINL